MQSQINLVLKHGRKVLHAFARLFQSAVHVATINCLRYTSLCRDRPLLVYLAKIYLFLLRLFTPLTLGDCTYLVNIARSDKRCFTRLTLRYLSSNHTYDLRQMKTLYAVLRGIGAYICAVHIRQKIQELYAIHDPQQFSRIELNSHIIALIEQGKIRSRSNLVDYLHRITNINTIYPIDKSLELWFPHEAEGCDNEYSCFLRNNSVVLFGPSTHTLSDFEDSIMNQSIVIMPSITENSFCASQKLPLCTYLTGNLTRKFFKETNKQFLSSLRYITVKTSARLKNKKLRIHQKLRCLDSIYPAALIGSFNLLPIMLADLLTCGAKPYVFNFDLMAKVSRTDLYYANNPRYQGREMSTFNNDIHDPLSQFCYVKHLYRLGLFKPSNELQSILELDCSSYASILQKQYCQI